MREQIKPIETHYKGYRFRSRLEARWAVFFDAIEIKWEYEKEGYDLENLGGYLPDFWLPYPKNSSTCEIPGSGHWLEVKGKEPTKKEISKLLELSRITKHSGFLVVGVPGEHKQLYTHRHGNFGWTDFPVEDYLTGAEQNCWMFSQIFGGNSKFREAIIQAKSARFV